MPHVLIAFFCLVFFSLTGFSGRAETKNLAEKQFWPQILHYKKNLIGSKYTSDVKSRSFFLSPEGNQDPTSELAENIKQFSIPLTKENAQKHAICRFPARYKWIAKELSWDLSHTNYKFCEKYYNWTLNGNIRSISIIFATGYFDNPASYFGHPLIKFNSNNSDAKLLDVSLNYGAMTPENENPVVYVLKGLFGGYHASFTHSQFFYHHHNYTESELRDLWEYELDLNQNSVDLIVDHSWELLGMHVPYVFLSDNCAYRMSELLELVLPTQLIPKPRPYAIPNTLFYNLGNYVDPSGRQVFKKVNYIPSRQKRMASRFNLLNQSHQKRLLNLVKNKTKVFSLDEIKDMNDDEKIEFVETLLEYYSFRLAKNKNDAELSSYKKSLILARFQLPMRSTTEEKYNFKVEETHPPHKGQSAFSIKAETVSSELLGLGYQLDIRFSLYDLLTPDLSKPKNTSLEVVRLKLGYWQKELELRELDFFSITTLNTSRTNLPEDGGIAWAMRIGYWPQAIYCQNCGVFGMKFGVGYANEFADQLTAYLLARMQLQNDRSDFGTSAVGPQLGILYDWNSKLKSHFTLSYDSYLDGKRNQELIYNFENRVSINQNLDLRLGYIEQRDKQYTAALSVYW